MTYTEISTDERYHFTQDRDCKRSLSRLNQYAKKVCGQLKSYGVHSCNRMKTGGFQYTGVGDTGRCDLCGLEVSGWIREMNPFAVHLERNPDCSFVRSIQSKNKSVGNHEENLTKRQKIELSSHSYDQQNRFNELNILKEVRRRTFSHWPHQTTPTKGQMIAAGFFQCNVGDRVICLYCNLICQQWKGDIDDPIEVHKTLSPKCPYVLFMLTLEEASFVLIVNEIPTNSNQALSVNTTNPLRFDQIVYTSPCHVDFISIPSRQSTFETWTNESSPSVDDLVKAGFYYTGTNNIVTCFYCNGSLQNWNRNDSPLIEHIRWFPHCAYAKQVSGNELYNKVQEAKRVRQINTTDNSSVSNSQRLEIVDEKLLSRLVAARLDLPISQRLLNQNFKLSIIKRCWEDQLKLKQDDFVSDCDLFIACVILQNQIEYINGNKDNIIVPSIKMKLISEREQSVPDSSSNIKDTSAVELMTVNITNDQTKTEEPKLPVNNPCVLCGKEEKRLACIPCGHLTACINCSQTLRTCPICRRGIEAFVRVYI